MNTKQAVCGIFAVLLLVSGMVFAQEKTQESGEAAAPGVKENAITLDTMPLFRGFIASDGDADTFFFCMAFAYERLVAPHFTFGAEIDLYPGKMSNVDYVYFALAAVGRFYPMSEYMEKFFIGANLGFNVQALDGNADRRHGGFSGLLIGLRAGYKLLFNDVFFVEPSMAYTYSKTGSGLSGGSDGLSGLLSFFGAVAPLSDGWQGGLRIGISF